MKKITLFTTLAIVTLLFTSCEKKSSNTTGWAYNDPDNGGFEYINYEGQETGPGLVFIEGGTFSMGMHEQDVLYDWSSTPRRVTIPSFYMDETEIRNIDYREYLYWLKRIFVEYPEVEKKARPDTLVWRNKLGYNEPYVEYYLRHPAYQNYPVVGVNWLQATDYCAWRTDRVNELIMVEQGFMTMSPTDQSGDNNFNTQAYLAGQYEGSVAELLPDLSPAGDERKVRMEDGILLPIYRLPTEAEWEYAALANIGNTLAPERVFNQRIFPWNGHYIRMDGKLDGRPEDIGQIRTNAVRGRGDYMGTAGYLNDHSAPTSPVKDYWPNDYGLYAMAGNVNEWVMDVYRDLTSTDANEFRPFRGNVYKTVETDEEGAIAEKDSLGRLKYREVTDEEAFNRYNYNTADNINYLDGDFESSIEYFQEVSDAARDNKNSNRMYDNGIPKTYGTWKSKSRNYRGRDQAQTMVNNRARVYKGGGWRDRVWWLSPGTRRFLDEEQARDDLGFRCVMDRLGSQVEE
jgi:gliding motility-associated lipoprotein GldJ